MFHERPIERSSGGLGRGFSHGNGIAVHQVQTGRTQQDRQEEEWSIPTNVERRENDTERHESPRAPAPAPLPQRIDYSQIGVVETPLEKEHHNLMFQQGIQS